MMHKKPNRIAKYFQYYKSCPVEKGTVFYHAYRTKIMAGNPYAIFLELINNEKYKDFHHYWVYSKEEQLDYDTFKKHSNNPHVHYVKDGSDEHMKALATCEYLFDNAALPNYWIKRPGQKYINTWHGTPLKSIGMAAIDSKFSSISNAQRNFFMCDYLVMPNKYTIDKLLDSYDAHACPGRTITDAGYPRIDLVVNADKKHVLDLLEKKSRTSLEGKKIVLYAPTFRSVQGNSVNTTEDLYQKIDEITRNLPDNYVMFFKVHNTLGEFFAKKKGSFANFMIFDEIETNELLSVVDVLITDYSSIFYDFLCTKRPILFFAYDREEYESQHGIYVDMESLPGPICYTPSDIISQINLIENNTYSCKNLDQNMQLYAYNDDGNASKRVVDIIFNSSNPTDYIYSDKFDDNESKRKILISMDDNVQLAYFLLLKRLLRTIDMDNSIIYIASADKDKLKPFLEKNYPNIQLILSHIVQQKEDGEVDEDYYNRQYEKYFYSKTFDCYYNLKPREAFIDDIIFACTNAEKHWLLNEDDYSVKLIKNKKYSYSNIEIIQHKEFSDLVVCNDYEILTRKDILSENSHPATVLVLTAFDSMNYSLLPCIKELQSRGCDVIAITKDIHDKNNNLVFIENGVTLFSVFDTSNAVLSYIDILMITPTKDSVYNEIVRDAVRKNVFFTSFAMLFSSIVMKTFPDILFVSGENKIDEFSDNFLQYNCVAVGNPQYDQLLPFRHIAPNHKKIKNVIIIDQGGYPYGEKGKRQLADTLIRVAKAHPEMKFEIKPRYFKGDTSTKTHNISEHLSDYLIDIPSNLSVMETPCILEDVVKNYDALITTWSTAYLDALVLNIPVILISGLDSIDVFDVRKQRVAEAYDKLSNTGCVIDYRNLGNENDVFSLINEDYSKKELYDINTPSAKAIVDILMLTYEKVLKNGKSIDDRFVCCADDFDSLLPSLHMVDSEDINFINKKKMRYYTNSLMQTYVYQNRCMGYLLDLSNIKNLMDELCEKPIVDFIDYYDKAKAKLEKAYADTLEAAFTREDVLLQVQNDAVLQSYYLEWLCETKRYNELLSFREHLLVPQSRYYFLAIRYLKTNKFLAYKYLFKFLDEINGKTICQTLQERRVSVDPFRIGIINKLFFYGKIIFGRNYYLLPLFSDTKLNRNAILCLLSMRYNNRVGNYSDNLRVFKSFDSIHQKVLQQRKKRSIKERVSLYIKKFLYKYIKKEYQISKNGGV